MSLEPYDDWEARKYRALHSWAEDDFFDPAWDDKQAEDELAQWKEHVFPHRIYYDEFTEEFKCHCKAFQQYSKCAHIWRYRKTTDVRVDKRYL
jgi:hypothetical protein